MFDKNKIFLDYLKQEEKHKEKIQEIVDNILSKIVHFRKLQNAPEDDYIKTIRKEHQGKKFHIINDYGTFKVDFNKKKVLIHIVIYNKKTLIEYKIFNTFSDVIYKNSYQRFVGSRADYYELDKLLFEDISKIYGQNLK